MGFDNLTTMEVKAMPIPPTAEDKYRYREKLITELPDEMYTGWDFSHAVFDCDLRGKCFKNCSFFRTDFRDAIVDKTTEMDFSGARNPFHTKMTFNKNLPEDEKYVAIATRSQRALFTNECTNGVTNSPNSVRGLF